MENINHIGVAKNHCFIETREKKMTKISSNSGSSSGGVQNVLNEISRFQQKKKMNISQTCNDAEQQQITNIRAMEGIHFQEEILVDILSKLHIRSLLRFKCVSKYWSTLIAHAYIKMKGRLSVEERVESAENLSCYLFRLQEGLFKDKKAEFKEFLDKYPLSENERKLLGYDSGSDVHPSEDDNTEDEGSSAEEYDSEEVDDVESDDELDNDEDDDGGDDDGDGDDDDDDDDDVKNGELSAEQIGDLDKILCHMCYSVFLLEKFYKDREADLKEIQDKYPLSRHARQLLGYDSWSNHPSEGDNTKDDRTAVEEHDNEEVDASESGDGSDDGDDADEDTFDSAGIVA